jgi:hypothetical protein
MARDAIHKDQVSERRDSIAGPKWVTDVALALVTSPRWLTLERDGIRAAIRVLRFLSEHIPAAAKNLGVPTAVMTLLAPLFGVHD